MVSTGLIEGIYDLCHIHDWKSKYINDANFYVERCRCGSERGWYLDTGKPPGRLTRLFHRLFKRSF